jgi:hypothetical protein
MKNYERIGHFPTKNFRKLEKKTQTEHVKKIPTAKGFTKFVLISKLILNIINVNYTRKIKYYVTKKI